jgi:hypothetical protein
MGGAAAAPPAAVFAAACAAATGAGRTTVAVDQVPIHRSAVARDPA